LNAELFSHIEAGIPAANLIADTLHRMDAINRFFLRVSIEELNKRLNEHRE
jgi:hypothetical protein